MPKSLKASTLAIHWQYHVAFLMESSPAPLSQKEAGQLKLIYRKVGPYAKQVVDYAINNWAKFTCQARLNKGLATSPEAPHIGFLLVHCDVAMNMMLSEKKITWEEVNAAMDVLCANLEG